MGDTTEKMRYSHSNSYLSNEIIIKLSSQKGSVTIFVAFLIPVMMLMTMLVTDIGQLVFEKIRLQDTADMAALSAAAVQSVGLNQIADLNYKYEQQFERLTSVLRSEYWKDDREGYKAINYYKKIFKQIDDDQQKAKRYLNSYVVSQVLHIIINKNFRGAGFLGEPIIKPGNISTNNERRNVSFRAYSRDSRVSQRYSPYNDCYYWNSHLSRSRCRRESPIRYPDTVDIKKKIRQNEVSSEVKLLYRPKNFFLGKVVPKLNSVELTANAKAMPVGGNVVNGSPNYMPILIK